MNNDEIKEVTSSENSFDDSSYCSPHDLLDNIQIMRKQKQKKIDNTNYDFPYTKR